MLTRDCGPATIEDVIKSAIETIGPQVRTGLAVDQLASDSHAATRLAHAALQHIAHAELPADLPDVHGATFVREARIACDDKQRFEARQRGDDVLDEAVYEVSCSGSPLMFLFGSTAIEGLSGNASAGTSAQAW